MNPKQLFCIFIVALITLGGSCCKKDEQQPPSPPHEKYNYFVAKVDGKAWKICGPITTPWYTAQYFTNSYFDIEGRNSCDTSITATHIYMKIYNLNDTGKFIFGGTSNNYAKYTKYVQVQGIEYKTDSIHTGTIKIAQFDFTSNKISGTFQFDAFNTDSNKVISIIEGEFTNVEFYKF